MSNKSATDNMLSPESQPDALDEMYSTAQVNTVTCIRKNSQALSQASKTASNDPDGFSKPAPGPKPGAVADTLYTTAEVAVWLCISAAVLEKARSTGLGDFPPYVRVGRCIRYRHADIVAWLRAHRFNIDGSPILPDAA